MFRNAIIESGTLEEMELAIERIVREGKADLARFLERLYVMKSGTGGGFRYLNQKESIRIFGQEEPFSCSAACIRQLLMDVGEEVSEEGVRVAARTDGWEWGTILENIGPALRKLLPGRQITSGNAQLLPGIDNFAQLAELYARVSPESWIASLKPFGKPRHTVLVESISDGIVKLRDPWALGEQGWARPFGVEATMRLEDFVRLWEGCRYHFVMIVK